METFKQLINLISQGVAGAYGAPWWVYLLFIVLTCHITLVAVTLFLHRSKAHLAVKFIKPVEHIFRLWLWITTGMSTIEWVAVHRKHHAKVETDEDPHSPANSSVWHVLFYGVELYREETRNKETIKKYAHDIPRDFMERNIYNGWANKVGIVLFLFVNIALFGFIGISMWAVQMLCIPFLAAGVINGVCHYFGYRNFETPDISTNIVPWGIVIGGEELHNNHHAYPSSAKFSLKPWEFDMGWVYLVVMRVLGLVKINRVAPRPQVDYTKNSLDNETIRAIIRSRMHVVADYTRRVLMPLINEAKRSSSSQNTLLSTLNEVKSELNSKRKEIRINLEKLGAFDELGVGVKFRERLIQIWETTHKSQEKLYQAMRDWCSDAEESGIEYLKKFAQTMRGYSLNYQWH